MGELLWMRRIGSALLWGAGGIWFLLIFFTLGFGLFISKPKRLFPLVRHLARLQLRVVGVRLEVVGRRRFDPHQRWLMMGNHQSLFDVFAIPAAIPGHAVGVEAAYHFSLPLWGRLTRWWGNIPIQRRDRVKAIHSLALARQRFEDGTCIVVLPEGHRTRDGEVGLFKKGPFYLALEAKADILPFALCGLFEFAPRGRFLLRPGKALVVFGEPIPFAEVAGNSVETLRNRVRDEIVRLYAEGQRRLSDNG